MTPRMLQGVTFKVVGIAVLALLMLIPLAQVNGLIAERRARADEAAAQIAQRWGAQQVVGGPVLVVPVLHERARENGVVTVEEREYLLPDRLIVHAALAPETRSYGLYEATVYVAEMKIEGRFASADVAALASGGEPQWQRAELRVPIADVRGIRRVSALRFDGRELTFGPAAAGVATFASIAAPFAFGGDVADAAKPRSLPFAFELTLAGSERLATLPLARQTDVHAEAPWPDPGFDGAYLPASHRVAADGFSADWQVLDLNRRLGQRWSESESAALPLAETAFGVSLVRPANAYQQNVRAGKYGVLFIALTFVAFFLFEVLRGLRMHPVQYLLIGLALCTFYVVLLALSERFGFGIAYAAAAVATVAIVGGYAAAVLAQRRAGAALAALLGIVYALLYGLVVSEDYALLMGALALLMTVAALMYLTRRVDWYAMAAEGRSAADAWR
jgi:inner membrane protein